MCNIFEHSADYLWFPVAMPHVHLPLFVFFSFFIGIFFGYYSEGLIYLKAYLKEYGEEDGSDNEGDDGEDADGMKHVGDGFYLYKDLYEKLYTHQKAGVLWLWSLYQKGKGGILGDDMG